MTEASVARPLPWSFRLFEALPLPPFLAGIAVTAALLAFYFGVEYATGQIDLVLAGEAAEHIPRHFRNAVVNALLIGYLPVAQIYLTRWTRRNLAELRPLLDASGRGGPAKPTEPVALCSASGRLAGVVGASLLPLLFIVLPAEDFSRLVSADYWIFEHAWDNLITLPLGWLGGRFFYAIVADSRRISRLASELATLDLLDPSPLQPFVRQGLRSALLAVVFVSVGSGHLGNIIVSTTAMTISLALMLSAALTALALPLRGVHERIREEKQIRLDQLRSAIRAREQELLAGGPEAARASAALPGLLALETRIAGVREWPLDTSNLLRLVLYVGLGVGSWIGGAAVERLLDRALA